jgi:hypothetical protein
MVLVDKDRSWSGGVASLGSREGIVSTEIDWVFRHDIADWVARTLSWPGMRAYGLPDGFRLDGSGER